MTARPFALVKLPVGNNCPWAISRESGLVVVIVRFVERAMDREKIELGGLRFDHPVGLAHTCGGQFAGDGEQRVGRVVGAELGHLRKLLGGDGSCGLRRGGTVVGDEMLGEAHGQRLEFSGLDLGHGHEGHTAKGLEPEPAVRERLPRLAGEIALGPVRELEAAREAPFAGARGARRIRSKN